VRATFAPTPAEAEAAARAAAVVLETRGLTKRYGRRAVVNDLSLSVGRGDICGFLGQNGAGKSTTLRMIAGLVRPTSGEVFLLGHDVRRRRARALRRVGVIIESPAFYDNFTGRANLRMLASLSGGATKRRIEEVLEIVGLGRRAGDAVRVYSYGMRQRLGIAQALLPDPDLVILDEPTNGLDPQGIREVRDLVRRLRDEFGLTVLLSSHLLSEVEQLCDRVAIIDQGRLLYQGPTAELVAAATSVRVTVDRTDEARALLASEAGLDARADGAGALVVEADAERAAHLNSLLVARGFKVSALVPVRETLEDVYLRLTAGGEAAREEKREAKREQTVG
jgi:ABC-2 type transport system ATP-binding protein